MKDLVISFEDGRISELFGSFVDDAKVILRDEYGDNMVFGDWEDYGRTLDNEQCYRMLCWRNEAEAENDNGRQSVAMIERVGDE